MKKRMIILSIILILGIGIFLINNNTSKMQISNLDNDFDSLAFYLQSEEGSEEYNSVNTIPSKNDGYIFKEAVCNDNSNVSFNNYTWSLKVSSMENGKVRCKLYFDIDNDYARRYILSQNTVNEGTPDFSKSATTNEGIFTAEDDYGTSYYYRGAVENNYFYFAGFYWRIVRINGDGTLRLIYQGTSATSTGESANAIKSAWNTEINDNAYIGYMYGTPGSSTYEETHANINNTTIKTSLDNWYQNNLLDYEEYISKESTFCGDRQISSGTGIGTSLTKYLPSTRLSSHEPTLKCSNEQDLYTLKDASIGNKALTYPIALITADEVAMAGAVTSGTEGEANNKYYLYTGTTWRTMTPESYGNYSDGNNPKVFGIDGGGILRWFQGSSGSHGVRPVININKNVKLEGTGTASDPYRITNTDLEDLSAKDTILTNSTINEETPNFKQVATTDEGIYKTEDDYGISYYFRGAVENNYLKFAGYLWRIIRINGDNSIRIIYEENIDSSNENQPQDSVYNNQNNLAEYVGYKYTINEAHGINVSSTIKSNLEEWYNSSGIKQFEDKIATGSGATFCNDRSVYGGVSTGIGQVWFFGYQRIRDNTPITLKCKESKDKFDVSVGLITVDEIAYAGGVWGVPNQSFYLYNGQNYWTMTPAYSPNAVVFQLYSDGSIDYDYVDNAHLIRPVINLRADVQLTGSGTSTDPYVVVGAS